MTILGIIPARYASTRFPAKPLVRIGGISMIERVYRQAAQAKRLQKVVVATDHEEIAYHVRAFGGQVCMTSPQHTSGTDRCREVLDLQTEPYDFVINVQGDEPFIAPAQIDLLAHALNDNTQLATLIKTITREEDLTNPNVVKVVTDQQGKALYFSRSPIPFLRGATEAWLTRHRYNKHIGMYAYRADVLRQVTALLPSALEQAESLEQLRWLENGYVIQTARTELETMGIDTPADLDAAEKFLRQ